ncbi:MAG: KpsF/GutQ family sugar-phosphate isomerase [Planctomycetes bacterium]|nr:KpsF/GutQ family sugar-phosphate isomerase [Planctomycetota bacterium]
MSEAPELEQARHVLETEAQAILQQRDRLGPSFVQAVDAIATLKGKVVITGVGKSGIVGMKIASTLASTGTPAVFVHPVEGVHGDLGIVSRDDLLVAISNSGETEEVLNLTAAARRLGVRTLGICASASSTLARTSDLVLPVAVDREACPLGLAPTASTTAVLAVGDALAMALSTRRRFTAENYAAFHPGGTLGRRLKLRVRDLMRRNEAVPRVREDQTFAEALQEMTARDNLGVTLVVDAGGKLAGILTDGDLRRILLRSPGGSPGGPSPVSQLMTRRPKTVEADAMASEAVQIMETHAITSLAIVDAQSRPVGIIHLHDILGRGKIIL